MCESSRWGYSDIDGTSVVIKDVNYNYLKAILGDVSHLEGVARQGGGGICDLKNFLKIKLNLSKKSKSLE